MCLCVEKWEVQRKGSTKEEKVRYYNSTLVHEMERQDSEGFRLPVDEMIHDRVLKEIQNSEQQLSGLEYQNISYRLIRELDNKSDYPLSSFFVVLPSDIDS